jgi:hypothetical protein
VLPVIAAGREFTVTTVVAVATPQLLLIVYVMIAVPAELAARIPEEKPTPATAVLLLDHVPPSTELVSKPVVP